MPPFSIYDDEETSGLGSAMDYGLNFRSALDSTDYDIDDGFGIDVDTPDNRSRDLIDSENEIHLDRFRKLSERAMTPDYQLSPSEAFATTILSILPAAAGYMIGGPSLAAQTSQIDGGNAYLKNLEATDQQERSAALQVARMEGDMYRQNAGVAQQDRRFQQQSQLQRERLEAAGKISGERLNRQRQMFDDRQANADRVAKDKFVREQKAYQIRGYEMDPEIPGSAIKYKQAAPIISKNNELQQSIAEFRATLASKNSSLDQQRAAYYGLINNIKSFELYGANFSKYEQFLSTARIPSLADITSLSSITDAMLQTVRGVDALGKLDDMSRAYNAETIAAIQPYGYYPPGSYPAPAPTPQQGKMDVSMYDIPTQAQILTESNANPGAVSPKGYQGMMQLGEAAVTDVARALNIAPEKAWEIARTNPRANVFFGQMYQAMMLDRQGGNETKALAAYNAGAGNVQKYGGVPPFKETKGYIDRYNEFKQLLERKQAAQKRTQ